MRERACLGVGILRLCWGRRRVAFTPLALATGPKFRKSSVYAVLRAKCWSGFAGTQIPKPSTGAALRGVRKASIHAASRANPHG